MKFLICVLATVLTACGGGGDNSATSNVTPTINTVAPSPAPFIQSTATRYPIKISIPNKVLNYAVGDLNGDGLDDVVIGGWTGNGTSYISILIQNLDGTLTDRTKELLDNNQYPGSGHTLIGDFDHDGYPDIWLPGADDWVASSPSLILWGSASGRFTRQAIDAGISSAGACLADLNGDGNLDLLIRGTFNPNTDTSGYYLNSGNRTFSTVITHQYIQGASACAVVRDNATGHFAVFQGGNNQMIDYSDSISIVDANLNLIKQIGIPRQDTSLAGINGVVAVDVNGDGLLDFVINYEAWSPGEPGRKEVWLNQGSDNFVYSYTIDTAYNSTGNILEFAYQGNQYCFFVGANSGLYKRTNGKLILFKYVPGVSVVYRGLSGLYVLEEGFPNFYTYKL
jgi:hypothetical protein